MKVTVKGETFFLCCNHCKGKLDADPDKYLAKLVEIRKAQPTGDSPAAGKTEAKPE